MASSCGPTDAFPLCCSMACAKIFHAGRFTPNSFKNLNYGMHVQCYSMMVQMRNWFQQMINARRLQYVWPKCGHVHRGAPVTPQPITTGWDEAQHGAGKDSSGHAAVQNIELDENDGFSWNFPLLLKKRTTQQKTIKLWFYTGAT